MKNYHIVAATERDKYLTMDAIRAAGGIITNVSGYGSSYYINFDATEDQADYIDRMTYSSDIHNLDTAGILAAWAAGKVTVFHMLEWQTRHGVILEVTA